MRKARVLSILFVVVLLAVAVIAGAQQPQKIPRIGFLGTSSPSAISTRVEGFRQGLRENGYVEGQNIAIEYRWAEGKLDRLPKLAADLVSHKLDIIVTHGDAAIRALKQATKTIPIVVGVTGDLVVTGHAASLARPGGNIMGFVDTSPDLSGKRLELLKEILPKVSRIAILWNAANPVKVLDFKETEAAAQALGLKLQSLEVKASQDFENKFKIATTLRSGALVVLQDALTTANTKSIVDFAAKNRLPAMYGSSEVVDVGGLMSTLRISTTYSGVPLSTSTRSYKGAKPTDLLIEQPTKFEFIINLKAAKQIGLTIPPNVLARADRVIQ